MEGWTADCWPLLPGGEGLPPLELPESPWLFHRPAPCLLSLSWWEGGSRQAWGRGRSPYCEQQRLLSHEDPDGRWPLLPQNPHFEVFLTWLLETANPHN